MISSRMGFVSFIQVICPFNLSSFWHVSAVRPLLSVPNFHSTYVDKILKAMESVLACP